MTDAELPTTVLYPRAFLRSPSADFDGVYDWDFWAPAINRRNIRPCDVDAVVEIKGFFLMAETKDPGMSMDDNVGQKLTRRAMINTGLVTYIYQWGKKDPVQWQVENFNGKSTVRDTPIGLTIKHDIADYIRRWANHHDQLNHLAWRRRLIEAALHGASLTIDSELYSRLRRGHEFDITSAMAEPIPY